MYDPVPVFGAEREAGLEDAVAAGGRFVMAALALPHDAGPGAPPPFPEPGVGRARATNLGQADLYYLKSVLATTGLNRNDDFFDRAETFAARKTPEDKPFNFEHRQDDIIGHITACWVVDDAGAPVPDDAAADALPDKFHLYTTAVIYRYCDVPARQAFIDKTIAELAAGKWYVSMECLFKGFDYLLVPKDAAAGGPDLARAKVVERTDKTAFLTKHLRAYGGRGEWNGQRVGRVLRNIVFHGKGLVEKPANPESVIFAMSGEPLSGAAANFSQVPPAPGYGTDSRTAAQHDEDSDVNEVEKLQAQVADLSAKLQKAEAAVKEHAEKGWAEKLEAVKAEAAAAAEKLAKAEAAEKAATQAAAQAAKAADESKARAEAAEKAKAEAEGRLAAIAAEKRYADRLAAVKANWVGVETDEDAKALLDAGLADLPDDKFAAQADYMSKKKAAYAAKPGESKVSDLPAPMGGGSKKVKAAGPAGGAPAETKNTPTEKVATAALDAAVPTNDPALAVGGQAETPEELTRADVLKFLTPDSK